MRMKQMFRIGVATVLACLTSANTAPVSPNPKSLLKTKRVLVVEAKGWNGTSHETAKAAALAKLNLIKSAVGITSFTVVDNVENYTYAILNGYDIIVFNFVFNSQFAVGKDFEKGFKQWIASGNRGWVGYHTSGANDNGEWPWFRDTVTAMRYHVHTTAAQQGSMKITTNAGVLAHPIMQGMPETFTGIDEWYDFDVDPGKASPLWQDCQVTYYLDETTLGTKPTRPMNPHPMSWYRQDKMKNRFYYSAFIHTPEGVNTDFFHSSILRGLEYAAGYDSSGVDISSHGNSIQTLKGLSYVTNSKELHVDAAGKFSLSIYSSTGAHLLTKIGEGSTVFVPEPFKNPGLYVVRFKADSKAFTQKIMVY